MSKSKSYNSVLFLTTLSVYLGLVLVGASPQILAQQITFVNKFEIQNEIEFEDDLDKKPEDDESPDKKISHNANYGENPLFAKNEEILSAYIENAFEQTNCTNENCFKQTSGIDKFPTIFIAADKSFNFPLTSHDFALKSAKKSTVHSTEIFSENNQVFIITRLPRGSLDALL